MKKSIILLLVILIFTVGAISCDRNREPAASPKPAAQAPVPQAPRVTPPEEFLYSRVGVSPNDFACMDFSVGQYVDTLRSKFGGRWEPVDDEQWIYQYLGRDQLAERTYKIRLLFRKIRKADGKDSVYLLRMISDGMEASNRETIGFFFSTSEPLYSAKKKPAEEPAATKTE